MNKKEQLLTEVPNLPSDPNILEVSNDELINTLEASTTSKLKVIEKQTRKAKSTLNGITTQVPSSSIIPAERNSIVVNAAERERLRRRLIFS